LNGRHVNTKIKDLVQDIYNACKTLQYKVKLTESVTLCFMVIPARPHTKFLKQLSK